jgi:hypothetical protein
MSTKNDMMVTWDAVIAHRKPTAKMMAQTNVES